MLVLVSYRWKLNKKRKISENILKVKKKKKKVNPSEKTHSLADKLWMILSPLWSQGWQPQGTSNTSEKLPYPWSSIWAWGAPNAVIPQGSIRLDASGKRAVSVPKSQTNQVFPEYQLCAQSCISTSQLWEHTGMLRGVLLRFQELGNRQVSLEGSSWEKAIKIHITKGRRLFLF